MPSPPSAKQRRPSEQETDYVRFIICTILIAIGFCRANDSTKEWNDLVLAGKVLSDAGNYSAAATSFQKAVSLANHFGVNDRQLLELHDALAGVYVQAGRFSESETEYRRALALVEKNEGRDSLNYAVLLASMSVLPTQITDPGDAVALMLRAIDTHRKTGSAQGLAIVRECVAQILRKEKRYQEEESLLLDALADLAEQKAPDLHLMAASLSNLAVLRLDQTRYQESVTLQQQSVRVLETRLGKEHPSLVAPLNDLATTYVTMNRLNDAQLTYERAIDICTRTLGEDHLAYGVLLENYAVVLRKLGRKAEARKAERRGWQIERRANSRGGVGSTIRMTALRPDSIAH